MDQKVVFISLFVLGSMSVVVFNFVAFFGAPFLPTKRSRVQEALDLLDLKSGQTLLELGSGDGRLLRAAAQREIYSIGYELNPVLVVWTRLRSWRQRSYITVHCANYWREPLPDVNGIYVFLLQPYMTKLDQKINDEQQRPLRLVSFAFSIPAVRAVKEQAGLYVYDYQLTKH